jgi:hypothetical protein
VRRSAFLLLLLATACGGNGAGDPAASSNDELKLPDALAAQDFSQPMTKASIRALQTWIDDATFETKWAAMRGSPIEFFGSAVSAYHADLATLPAQRLPGGESLCHGDAKFDNFGWMRVDGKGIFSDGDFDDAGYCPVAADVLKYLVATDLWFADSDLDAAALKAYVDTVDKADKAFEIDRARSRAGTICGRRSSPRRRKAMRSSSAARCARRASRRPPRSAPSPRATRASRARCSTWRAPITPTAAAPACAASGSSPPAKAARARSSSSRSS